MLLLPPLAADIMDVIEHTPMKAAEVVTRPTPTTVSPETRRLLQAFCDQLRRPSTTQTARFGEAKEFPCGNPRK